MQPGIGVALHNRVALQWAGAILIPFPISAFSKATSRSIPDASIVTSTVKRFARSQVSFMVAGLLTMWLVLSKGIRVPGIGDLRQHARARYDQPLEFGPTNCKD